ncbi:hypothetical protein TSUD_218060 [Trifolium subterraneum]|uniref:Rab-GAP TBC domain-containing protein n=1 Tax=Trifolium subterraneum TaxID=3900 RepID=A0A2Z6NEU7_TRISU|nr:hypothetical protein TSUD_218060 [Trifolium subterraneum]
MFLSTNFNANNDTPFLSGGGGGNKLSFMTAVTTAPSTTAVLFTAFAGIAFVVLFFYGASRRSNNSSSSSSNSSPSSSSSTSSSSWIHLRSVLFVVTSSSPASCSSSDRKKYEKLRRQCRQLLNSNSGRFKLIEIGEINYDGDGVSFIQDSGSPSSEDAASARESLSSGEQSPDFEYSDDPSVTLLEGDDAPNSSNADASALDTDSTDSDSSESPEVFQAFPSDDGLEENNGKTPSKDNSSPSQMNGSSKLRSSEDFATWQRIIRLDAVRANSEWMPYSPSQAVVAESRAHRSAEAVGLKDYGHLDAGRIFHAARLVAILEAYALYDPEIGYCQGMSDLLSPIISVISEDHEAFWCFVGFMKKARQNFRLDEVGIRRQLDIVAKIIKFKDSHLFRHLQKLQAEDCFFVYRMVVVLFRRELTFEQTLCLWEVMWADQAAIRAGIGKSAWSRIRQRAPPTDDLLLFAIAASVLQRRKLILEKYSSMDDILKECNGMAGRLDVWKLLDDAHNLVVTLHDKMKIEASFQ